jgi:hypothetical protein
MKVGDWVKYIDRDDVFYKISRIDELVYLDKTYVSGGLVKTINGLARYTHKDFEYFFRFCFDNLDLKELTKMRVIKD